MTMSFLHNRPMMVALILAAMVAGCHGLVGCASMHPGSDQCDKCYIGLGQALGTNP